jgi:uncharacterized protein
MSSVYDVWSGKPQAARRKVITRIVVAGVDVTAAVNPRLQNLTVILKMAGISTATLDLDDRDGQLVIPGHGDNVVISLGWSNEGMYETYTGWVESVESGFERQAGGRRLWIDLTAVEPASAVKSPTHFSWGEGAPPGQAEGTKKTFGEVLGEMAAKAGVTLQISPRLAGIQRDFWHSGTTSLQHFGAAMAEELGGAFSFSGNTAAMTDLQDFGMSAAGNVMPGFKAVWGDNLIAWRIKPFATRPQWAAAQAHAYDTLNSVWNRFTSTIGGIYGNATSNLQLPHPAPNQTVGDQVNAGQAASSQYNTGQGWVTINGEPALTAGSPITISGARDGIDGTYTCWEVQHIYDRKSGYTTRCQVRWPTISSSDPGAAAGTRFDVDLPAPSGTAAA